MIYFERNEVVSYLKENSTFNQMNGASRFGKGNRSSIVINAQGPPPGSYSFASTFKIGMSRNHHADRIRTEKL
jgi:hypothetical protein